MLRIFEKSILTLTKLQLAMLLLFSVFVAKTVADHIFTGELILRNENLGSLTIFPSIDGVVKLCAEAGKSSIQNRYGEGGCFYINDFTSAKVVSYFEHQYPVAFKTEVLKALVGAKKLLLVLGLNAQVLCNQSANGEMIDLGNFFNCLARVAHSGAKMFIDSVERVAVTKLEVSSVKLEL